MEATREGLFIEGLGPEYDRNLCTGPSCNFIYSSERTSPVDDDGKPVVSWDDASSEFKSKSVPLKKMPNRLPYAEICTLEEAINDGYTIIDFYTHEPYSREKALQSLYHTSDSHRSELYYSDALHLRYEEVFSTAAKALTNTTSKNAIISRSTHDDDSNDEFYDAPERKPPKAVTFEEVLSHLDDGKRLEDYFSRGYEIYHDAHDTTFAMTNESPTIPKIRLKAKRMPSARSLRKMAMAAGVVFSCVALCYGRATESTMRADLVGCDSRSMRCE